MKIIFEKPPEYMYQAYIDKRKLGNVVFYELAIGGEGSEHPASRGKFLSCYAVSNFMKLKGIEKWVGEKVKELRKNGERIDFIGNSSCLIDQAIIELAEKSQSDHYKSN